MPKATHGLSGKGGIRAQVSAASVWCSECGAMFPLQWPTEQGSLLGPTRIGVNPVMEIRSKSFKEKNTLAKWMPSSILCSYIEDTKCNKEAST